MIKLIRAHYQGNYQVALSFSDGKEGVFDGRGLLQRSGPLLEPPQDEAFFGRLFTDTGALCWPNAPPLTYNYSVFTVSP